MSFAARAQNPESLPVELLNLYRRATPAEKLALIGRINASLLALKAAQVVSRRPALSSADRAAAVRRWWLGARD